MPSSKEPCSNPNHILILSIDPILYPPACKSPFIVNVAVNEQERTFLFLVPAIIQLDTHFMQISRCGNANLTFERARQSRRVIKWRVIEIGISGMLKGRVVINCDDSELASKARLAGLLCISIEPESQSKPELAPRQHDQLVSEQQHHLPSDINGGLPGQYWLCRRLCFLHTLAVF